MRWFIFSLLLFTTGAVAQKYAKIPTEPKPGDIMLAKYFALQTQSLEDDCLAEIKTAADWKKARGRYRGELFEMLGIPPDQPRGEMNARVTGSQEYEDILIENVIFQSLPGLYVTANFYRPKKTSEKPLPSILYVCGHSSQKLDGVSLGNKTAYHHHGVWFAKQGYTCLMIDTIQLGEIEGTHHGTYREGRWWWNSRGYTPAGVEAWNGIRALDYLQSRPEVDGGRLGMTGRSGGGAYSWWVAALDERVKVAVPVAGITSLHNHVVDGVVEGHCDCMFHVNTYRWDFPAVAALIAPRPLLIANTDKDPIFPLDGVVDVYTKTRRIYELLGAGDKIGLAITEGPHKDTQPLRTVAFEWFERHLKGQDRTDEFDTQAPKVLDRTTMRALEKIPQDEIVTNIDESFVTLAAAPEVPTDAADWQQMRDGWMKDLRGKCFRGWPDQPGELKLKSINQKADHKSSVRKFEFQSQATIRLPFIVITPPDATGLTLVPVDEKAWKIAIADDFAGPRKTAITSKRVIVIFPPRGIGPTAWTNDERERVHIRRRFMLLGQTLDGMRVWDIRRAITALNKISGLQELPLSIEAEGAMASHALYAALFSDRKINALTFENLPGSHRHTGPDYLNILRYLDLPMAVAMAAESHNLSLKGDVPKNWNYPTEVASRLQWQHQFKVSSEE